MATLSLEGTRGAGPGDGGVVADDAGADHEDRLRNDRVDLAGHDRRARLQVGDVQLAQPGVGAGAHPAQVVVDLGEADGQHAERAGGLDQGVAGALRLEVVARLGDGQARLLREAGDDLLREAGGRVDAGADGRAAERDLRDTGSAERTRSMPSRICMA